MATKKTGEATTKPTKAKETVVDKEKELLKKQMEEMKAQMELMAKMIATSKEEASEKATTKKVERQIPFVNMTCGSLVLKGNSFYTIDKPFEERRFLEREARVIVNNMRGAIEKGYVYIADAKFVEDCELDYLYANLLDKEQLQHLFENNAEAVVEAYKSASEGQRETIINMIENKRLAGEYVDANVLVELGALANKDLMGIEPDED